MSGTSGPTPRTEIGSVSNSRHSSMQDAYTFEERCGDNDVLIENADSFSVLLKCIRNTGGRSGSAEVKMSSALMQLCDDAMLDHRSRSTRHQQR